jgi:hypothetical protein
VYATEKPGPLGAAALLQAGVGAVVYGCDADAEGDAGAAAGRLPAVDLLALPPFAVRVRGGLLAAEAGALRAGFAKSAPKPPNKRPSPDPSPPPAPVVQAVPAPAAEAASSAEAPAEQPSIRRSKAGSGLMEDVDLLPDINTVDRRPFDVPGWKGFTYFGRPFTFDAVITMR